MSLPKNASICLKDKTTEVCFFWEQFDGDDCFAIHYITINVEGNMSRFDCGRGLVYSLKKLKRFLMQVSEASLNAGFGNPNVRCYDLLRSGDSVILVLNFGDSETSVKYKLEQPEIILDGRFLG